MSRIKRQIVAVAAGLMVALSISGSALAAGNGSGNSGDAPGQGNAQANCGNTIVRQTENGVQAGGGPKAGFSAPTNCDHFFSPPGHSGG